VVAEHHPLASRYTVLPAHCLISVLGVSNVYNNNIHSIKSTLIYYLFITLMSLHNFFTLTPLVRQQEQEVQLLLRISIILFVQLH